MCMRTGFGVGERSRRLRRPCEPECERGRSLGRSGLLRLPGNSKKSCFMKNCLIYIKAK